VESDDELLVPSKESEVSNETTVKKYTESIS
jgi:hypothetical protein